MAHGITLAMREIKKPEPVVVHNDGTPYVNPARDLKPGRRLRKELRGKVQPTTVTLIVEEAA